MTVLDMVCLADMWINLSHKGQFVQTIVLPGNMTGRQHDRYFQCNLLGSAPKHNGQEWQEYLHEAVDHVDFVEVSKEEWNDERPTS
jgi:hypothetical protein